MPSAVRKFTLTAHVASSVGWLGAVASFLALAIVGLTSSNASLARAAYPAMELIGWCVIVPFSVATLLTGLAQSLGSPWGLFRHYWIVAKLAITVLASVLLVVHMKIATQMANIATETTVGSGDFRGLRLQLVVDASAAVVVLLIATALSVYKPQGLTPFGRTRDAVLLGETTNESRWRVAFGLAAVTLIAFVLIKHLSGGGFGHHH